jgi:hypothetical protein
MIIDLNGNFNKIEYGSYYFRIDNLEFENKPGWNKKDFLNYLNRIISESNDYIILYDFDIALLKEISEYLKNKKDKNN